jgi:hypothetical protein
LALVDWGVPVNDWRHCLPNAGTRSAMEVIEFVFLLIVMFHPVWLTILVVLLLLWLLKCTGLWLKNKRVILLGAAILYAIDAAIALPRIVYAWRSSDSPVIHQKAELPARLVLINVDCEKECHARLISGELEEVILVGIDRLRPGVDTSRPRRYRARWVRPGTCPLEQRRAIGYDARELARDGFCPVVEPTDIPTEGIFVVKESLNQTVRQKAVPLVSTHLVDSPPGKTIQLRAVEVQRRTRDGVELLAARRRYLAPGLLGLPPLVGCWVRIDNMLGIYPPGDTGCGLWRWFTWGGDHRWQGEAGWVYGDVFTRAARHPIPPPRADTPPVGPAEAVEILSRVSPVEDYLPALKDALVAPSVSDDMLVDLVVQRARRGTLDGVLIAVLAAERPAAAAALPARLEAPPTLIRQPDLILTEMERDSAIFEAWRDFIFDALASNWSVTPGQVAPPERYLALLRERDPDFLCQRLDRVTRAGGLLDHRDNVTVRNTSRNYFEAMPRFLEPLINAAVRQCGERSTGLLHDLLAAPAALRREQVAFLVPRLPGDFARKLADQAFANLLDDRGMDHADYKVLDRRQRYVYAHLQILLHAGQSCDNVERKLNFAVADLRDRGETPSPQVIERLAYLNGTEEGVR